MENTETKISGIDPTKLYSISFVADYIGVHRETVKEWYQDGKLGCVRMGYRIIRIFGSQLIEFIQSSREEANFIKRVNLKERKYIDNDKEEEEEEEY